MHRYAVRLGSIALSVALTVVLAPSAGATSNDRDERSGYGVILRDILDKKNGTRGLDRRVEALEEAVVDLQNLVLELQLENSQQSDRISALEAFVFDAGLDTLLSVLSVNESGQLTVDDADLVVASGNLYVQNGTGITSPIPPDVLPNGKGNIIIGYDESHIPHFSGAISLNFLTDRPAA